MNLSQIWKRFQSLNPEQKAFLREKQIHATQKRQTWMDFLAPLCEVDAALDKVRRLLIVILVLSLLVSVGCAFMLESPIPLAGLILVPVTLIARYRIKRWDIPSAPRSYLLPLLALLQEETDANGDVEIKLDLQGYAQKAKWISKEGPSHNTLETYLDPWMQAKVALSDGSQLSWEFEDKVLKRHRRKRSSSGKTKWKTKIKVKRFLDVRLRVLNERFPSLDSQNSDADSDTRIHVKAGEKRSEVRVRREFQPANPEESPDLKEFMDTIMAAYRRLLPTDAQGGVA
jgi:hypothetical protein